MKKQSADKPAKPMREQPHFSNAIKKIARSELKKFELQSDEDFLARAEIDRRLRSL